MIRYFTIVVIIMSKKLPGRWLARPPCVKKSSKKNLKKRQLNFFKTYIDVCYSEEVPKALKVRDS